MNIAADLAERFPGAVAGASIGLISDKSTWRIDYRDGAPDEAREEVAAYIAALADPALARAKAAAGAAIDAFAEAVRLRYITPGAGMAMTYQEKFAQAQGVVAMGEQAANAMSEAERVEQFPTLAASVGIEAATVYDCAQLVLARYTAFAALSHTIERARLAGKAAVKSASTVQGVEEVARSVAWPTP